jgi:hypothetical protein
MKVLVHPADKTIEVDGTIFVLKRIKRRRIGKVDHDGDYVFEELDNNKLLEKKGFIISRLAGEIQPDELIEEILKSMPVTEIEKIYCILKKKKTRVEKQAGCLGLFIDGGSRKQRAYISIMD